MLTFLFPGQGSQRSGMGSVWTSHPSWALVEECSEATGKDIAKLLNDTDIEELTQTNNAQLATFAMSVVILDAIERIGLAPAITLGHSLGEYTALVGSGILSVADGARLVSARGEAMRSAAQLRQGTMYAVLGLSDEKTDIACRLADGEAWLANYNAPGQVVIAGDPEALARAAEFAKRLGAKKVVPIQVGGAFHTPFMRPAREQLREAISKAKFHEADVPTIANVDAQAHMDSTDWPGIMSAQLCSPVRWHQSIAHAIDLGAATFVECGAGGVLAGLMKRCAPDATALAVASPDDLDKLLDLVTKHHATSVAAETEAEPILEPAALVINSDPPSNFAPSGEALFMRERLIVSPIAGVFQPLAIDLTESDNPVVTIGQVLGHVADAEVRSPFEGVLKGMLTAKGERVTAGQPIAWLVTSQS